MPFPCSAVTWLTDANTGKQYGVLNTKVFSYEDATKICQDAGGKLPEPRNSEENDFLDNFGTTTKVFFLGLTDTAAEGQWVWTSDDSTVTWKPWKSGEPDGGTSENCCAMYKNAQFVADKKSWKSEGCDQPATTKVPVVCELTRKYTIHCCFF